MSYAPFRHGGEEAVEFLVPPRYYNSRHSFIFEAILFLLNKAGIPCKMVVTPGAYSVENYYQWKASTNEEVK